MRPYVIKFGGSVFKKRQTQVQFLKELAALAKKTPVVLVHGGGPEINKLLDSWNIKTRFVGGLRYTDERVMEAVEMALSGKVNKSLVAGLYRLGAKAVGLSAKDGAMVVGRRIAGLGYAGKPVAVHTELLELLLKNRYLPVLSSVGISPKGESLNLNADVMACAVAVALKARRLIMLTDVPGVLGPDGRTIPAIRVQDVEGTIQKEVVTGGMIPKLRSAAKAVEAGVGEVDIIDGSKGLKQFIGTRIVA